MESYIKFNLLNMTQSFNRPSRPSAPRFTPPTQADLSAIQTALTTAGTTLKDALKGRFGTEVEMVQTAVIAAAREGVFDLDAFAANLGKSPDDAREMFELIRQSGPAQAEQALAADAGSIGNRVTAAGDSVIEAGEQ